MEYATVEPICPVCERPIITNGPGRIQRCSSCGITHWINDDGQIDGDSVKKLILSGVLTGMTSHTPTRQPLILIRVEYDFEAFEVRQFYRGGTIIRKSMSDPGAMTSLGGYAPEVEISTV